MIELTANIDTAEELQASIDINNSLDGADLSQNEICTAEIQSGDNIRAVLSDVNYLNADFDIGTIGVTSWNGLTGEVTYTAPVTSVNGSTGDVLVAVPTKTSELNNDSGFLTTHQSLANYYTKAEIDSIVGNIETLLQAI